MNTRPTPTRAALAGMLLLLSAVAAACGSTDEAADATAPGPPYEVRTDAISRADTQGIGVWAPDAEGTWPVVVGFHGYGGEHEAWNGLATELAKQGVVVFVPNYRSTSSSADDMKKDLVCGAQHAREVAGDYGGDVDLAYALVGHSLGASIVLGQLADVREGTDGSYDTCFEGMPDGPDAIVAMVGCFYEAPDGSPDTPNMPTPGTSVTFVAGEDDQVCEAWQSKDAAAELEAAGYDTTLVEIAGGTHGTPLFLDDSQEPWVPVPSDDPGGQRTVAAILDALESALG